MAHHDLWGRPSPETDEEYLEYYQDRISLTQSRQLLPLQEDLADWINKTLGIEYMNATNLLDMLDNGVILCHLAKLIQNRIQEAVDDGTEPGPVPIMKGRCFENAARRSFFSRDNMDRFIQFCRQLGVHQNLLFESEDLVLQNNPRSVILCLMEVARLASRYNIEPPGLVALEKEIAEEESHDSGLSLVSWQFQGTGTISKPSSEMLTRRARNNLTRQTSEEGIHLSEGLMHDEVIDFAIQIHSALSIISSRHSSEDIIDVVPHLVNILNRLDACLKINSDLLMDLTEISSENSHLKKRLEDEKRKRTLCLDVSLSNEEKADDEIRELNSKLSSLMAVIDDLKAEICSKDVIINLLSHNAQISSEKLSKLETEFSLMKSNSSSHTDSTSHDDFITPRDKVRARPYDTSTIILNNRFSPLSSNESLTFSSTSKELRVKAQVHKAATPVKELRNPSLKVSHARKKRRLTVLSCSQGKQLSKYLQHLDDEFEIFVYTKSGAKLKNVIQDGLQFVRDFTEDDVIVILAGTNDTHLYEPYQLTLLQGMDALLDLDINTNIVVCGVPCRYDAPTRNDDIQHFNSCISRMVHNYDGVAKLHYLDINVFLQRAHLTRHGLHLNRQGKRLLSKQLTIFIKQNVMNGVVNYYSPVSVENQVPSKVQVFKNCDVPESPEIQLIESFPVTPPPSNSPVSCSPEPIGTIPTAMNPMDPPLPVSSADTLIKTHSGVLDCSLLTNCYRDTALSVNEYETDISNFLV